MSDDETTAQLLRENEKLRAARSDILTVRDQFAKEALPLFLELEVTSVWNQSAPGAASKRDHAAWIARAAYFMADAMMAERASPAGTSAPLTGGKD